MTALLDVEDLTISLYTQRQRLQAVRGVSFTISAGESVGIVGESGCGKSTLAQSIVRLMPSPPCCIERGKVRFLGKELLELSEKELRYVRGAQIGFVFQDPMTSLNPTMTAGAQVIESVLQEGSLSRKAAEKAAVEFLDLVKIPEPKMRYHQYPHQLSGGLRQRVLIAIAIARKPRLLIADEPTTALDATIQLQILNLLVDLKKQLNMSLLLISHDMSLVTQLCDHVLVMYAGKILERGKTEEILVRPQHPYTRKLLQMRTSLSTPSRELLPTIEGSPPNLIYTPKGCCFVDRCQERLDICEQIPPPDEHQCVCWLNQRTQHDRSPRRSA